MVGRRARSRRLATAPAAGLLLLSGVAALRAPAAQALENGVARTPPMDRNSWSTFGVSGTGSSSQAWDATATAAGGAATASNVSYHGSLNAGGRTQFGFLGAVNGAPGAPTPRCTAA